MLFATALTDASIADALNHPDYRTLYIALGREVLGVAEALEIHPEAFNGFDPQAFMPDTPEAVSQLRLTRWWHLTANRRKPTAVSGATWRCANAAPRLTRSSGRLSRRGSG